MAKKEKTSKARYFTVRLNPETSPLDKDMLKTVDAFMAKGFSFKAIVQDAVLMADGKTPEMYSRFTTNVGSLSKQSVEDMLQNFAAEIVREIRQKGFTKNVTSDEDDEMESGDVSPFAARFAKSFLERQRQTQGNED